MLYVPAALEDERPQPLFGQLLGRPAAGGRGGLAVPPGVRLGRSRVVAFVQTSSLAIVGANEVELGGVVLKAGGPARVSGRLLDRAGGGVNGAQVQACSDKLCLPAATDSSGRFSVTGIPAGRYDLKLFLPKRSANPVVTLPVEVRAGEDISLPPVAVGT